MSGHSKWSKIKHKKGAADAKRGNIFTKLGKAITVAAQQGGSDIEMNFSLRLAVEKAKSANMPKDNIERAIKRGSGESKDGAVLQELIYEGFGPQGVGIMVEAVTDNNNRTASEVKHAFSKYGGSLGGPGAVQWQFSRFGVIHLTKDTRNKIQETKDAVDLGLIDAGADDIIDSEYGIEIRCQVEKFKEVLDAVTSFGIEPDDSGLQWIAKEEIELDEDASAQLGRIVDALDELDDVKDVFTNEA